MYGINRSAGATLGAAFLFISFTAIPVSLRAVGLNVHFSPSVNAVIDAWDEIAGAFQAESQPVTTELLAFDSQNGATPAPAPAEEPEQNCQLASNSEDTDFEPVEADVPDMIASPAEKGVSRAPRAKHAKPDTRSLLGGRSIELASVQVEPLRELEFRPIEIAQELKGLAINREVLLKDFQKRTSQIRQAIRFASSSKEFKVLVEAGKPLKVVRTESAPAWPCPPKYDIAPKVRTVRTARLGLPETENSEI